MSEGMEIRGVAIKARRYDRKCDINSIQEHPENTNIGDEESILESIQTNGFYGAVIVQESTKFILVGNHRHRSLVSGGSNTIPVLFIDVDDVEAMRILLVDNKTASAAEFDDKILAASLTGLMDSDRGIVGTGFVDKDLAAITDNLVLPEVMSSELMEKEGVRFSIGGLIRARVSQEVFDKWRSDLISSIGSSDEKEIANEIKRRLYLV